MSHPKWQDVGFGFLLGSLYTVVTFMVFPTSLVGGVDAEERFRLDCTHQCWNECGGQSSHADCVVACRCACGEDDRTSQNACMYAGRK